jgi:hypothetical protein
MEKTIATLVDDGWPCKTPSYRITLGLGRKSVLAIGDWRIALAVAWEVLPAWAPVDWAHSCAEYPHAKHTNINKKLFAGISCCPHLELRFDPGELTDF